MDELPELPFEKVLSYLSLEEVIKLRAVSRSCLWKIDNYKVKLLCYSRVPTGHIYKKHRWVSGAFAQNFIVSIRFKSFFKTFGQTILSHLKHLRLYEPDFHAESRTTFTSVLNSFVQLEELDIIDKWILRKDYKRRQLKVNLPMLKSVLFERVHGIEKLTLNAPILKRVKFNFSPLSLDLVHSESVESLLVQGLKCVNLDGLKNLNTIYIGYETEIDFQSLFDLEQLEAVHLVDNNDVRKLFDLKQRYGRTDLQIYRLGCLLNGPDDLALDLPGIGFELFNGEIYLRLDPSRLADEIPFWSILNYTAIEHLTSESQATILNSFTDLGTIYLGRPVPDIDRFLTFLNTFNHITDLHFGCDQLQTLFDRLPHTIQRLYLTKAHSDLEFLFKLDLIEFELYFPIDIQMIRRFLEELEFLQCFRFLCLNTSFEIFIKARKQFKVHINEGIKKVKIRDLNAVIQFVQKNASEEELSDMDDEE